jgi:hypothetical protein
MPEQEDDYTSPYILTTEQILQLGIPEHRVEIYRRKHYQDCFGVSSWYNVGNLATFTFKTIEADISYDEAQMIVDAYRLDLGTLKGPTVENFDALVQGLEQRLNALIEQHFPNGAFIKLNTRSPKDVPWRSHKDKKYIDLVEEELAKFDELTPNAINIAMIKAMNRGMKVENGKDCLELLTKSYRVYEDLQKQLNFEKELFDSRLVIREWIDEVAEHPEYEFRCFVHERNLHAVSQYFSDTYFDNLWTEGAQEKLQQQMIEFFDSVKNTIPHPSFVIDFFVSPTRGVMIVELNPFHIGAGACLFSWQHDREIFMNGPLEFRFNKIPAKREDYQKFLTIQWEKYLVANHQVDIPGHQASMPQEEEKSGCSLQ